MEMRVRLRQQAEMGPPSQEPIVEQKKTKKVKPKSDMRTVHGRLAKKLLKTVRRKLAGAQYREE